jgi:flotillin
MQKLGLVIDLLNIKDIADKNNYIEALGRKQTADIIRNATIGEAEAKRDSDIKAAEARKLGAVATTKSEQEISNAERERDKIRAENLAQVEAAKARVPLVSQAAAAEEQRALNIAKVEAERAKVEAEINLQDAVRRRKEAELNATTIVEATKEKEASVIVAEGKKLARIIEATADQDAAVLEGEASRVKAEKEGQGEQARMTATAIGRKAAAEAKLAEKEAEAAGEKALLLATADGERARLLAQAAGTEAGLLAEAKGVEARLLAEAEGALKKAEAFKVLDDAGRFLLILEGLPPVIAAIGEAASKVIVPAAEAIGEGLGNVNEIRLVQMNGVSSGGGDNVLSQFAKMPAETLFGLFQKLDAAGLLPALKGLAAKAGIDLDTVMKAGGKSTASESSAVVGTHEQEVN